MRIYLRRKFSNENDLNMLFFKLFIVVEYIQPFLDELSIVSNFSVKSQWLYLLPLDVNPRRVPDSSPSRRHFALRESVLPQLVTPLEKKLGTIWFV